MVISNSYLERDSVPLYAGRVYLHRKCHVTLSAQLIHGIEFFSRLQFATLILTGFRRVQNRLCNNVHVTRHLKRFIEYEEYGLQRLV